MLVIDIGNSRVKWAVVDESSWSYRGGEYYRSDCIESSLSRWFSLVPVQDEVVVCCVADKEFCLLVADWFEREWHVRAEFVSSKKTASGLTIAYADESQLGVDRWVAMISARRQYEGAICVIDCGTAVTLDVVDATGRHLGGLIMPGIKMMQESLISGTSAISGSSDKQVLLADNTQDAVSSGCIHLLVAGVSSLIEQYRALLQVELTCVITGGDGELLHQRLGDDCIYNQDLVLQGLSEFKR